MWPLAWAVVLMVVLSNDKIPLVLKWLSMVGICLITFPSDWSCIAVMAPVFIASHRGNFKKQALDIIFWSGIYAIVYYFFINKPHGILQMFTVFSVPILAKYNGKRGTWKGMKWFFYAYYPAHLVVIGILRLILH